MKNCETRPVCSFFKCDQQRDEVSTQLQDVSIETWFGDMDSQVLT